MTSPSNLISFIYLEVCVWLQPARWSQSWICTFKWEVVQWKGKCWRFCLRWQTQIKKTNRIKCVLSFKQEQWFKSLIKTSGIPCIYHIRLTFLVVLQSFHFISGPVPVFSDLLLSFFGGERKSFLRGQPWKHIGQRRQMGGKGSKIMHPCQTGLSLSRGGGLMTLLITHLRCSAEFPPQTAQQPFTHGLT